MSLQGLTDGGAIPALEAMARFSAARQRLIADNVANLDTPGYRPLDADPKAFQEQIGRAIENPPDGEFAPGNCPSGSGWPVPTLELPIRNCFGAAGLQN